MAGPGLAEFNETNFDAQVLGRSGLTVVDFWSDSCVPCKQLGRVLEQLAEEVPDTVLIGKVNTERNPELVARYQVRAVPALLFFKNGTVVQTVNGVERKQTLKKSVEAHA
jgi:thioredoxin 1